MEHISFIEICGVKYEKKNILCLEHGNTPAMSDGTCQKCFDNEELAKEKKAHEDFILSKKKHFEIPARFLNVNFDDINAVNDNQSKMLDFLKTYDYNQNVLLLGGVGSGKTTMAMATADKTIRENKSVAYIKYYNVTNLSPWSPEFAKLCKVDLLIIDEIGVSTNENKDDVLFKIIDQRYDNEKFCILISNSDIATFKSYLSPSAYSKVKENSKAFVTNWEDLRNR